MRKILPLFVLTFSTLIFAGPIIPMNKAFNSLVELIPFLTDEGKFVEKKNEKAIAQNLKGLEDTFKSAKHDSVLQLDIFAPSLELVRKEIKSSHDAFKQGKKDFALWRMRTITTHCMACHTRLPSNHTSSFQDGSKLINKKKFSDPYNLGLAQLIVRQYPEAKESFTRSIDEGIVKKQFKDILLPLKQLLLIQTKVMKDPAQMLNVVKHYSEKQGLSAEDRDVMRSWTERLKVWSDGPLKKWRKLSDDKEAEEFMSHVMRPIFKNNNLYVGKHDVDLLMAQGLLSNFLVENPESRKAPEALYWIGVSEKYLERENFFGSGELFLKQCIERYPKSPIAKECFQEFKESVEFNFSGSSGTDVPSEVQLELDILEQLIKGK